MMIKKNKEEQPSQQPAKSTTEQPIEPTAEQPNEQIKQESSGKETHNKEKDINNKDKEANSKDKGIDSKDKEMKDLVDTLQRLQAEFENYKKRVDKEYESMVKCSNEELIGKVIPMLDNFELALKNAKQKDEFYKGMELIYAQLISMMENEGVELIDCLDKKFDPYCHEALLAEESEKEPSTVIEELQKGYKLNGKVIRHSKVKIAKRK